MKKFTFTLLFATFATAAFSQLPYWRYNTDSIIITPSSTKLILGELPIKFTGNHAKLYVYQNCVGTVDPSLPPGTPVPVEIFYGIYSAVSGTAIDKYSGYFTGGKFAVMKGNVGIGTTSPQYPLEVQGTTKSTTGLFNKIGIGTTSPYFDLDIYGSMKSTEGYFGKGYFDDNVGIGTYHPQAALQVQNGNVAVINGNVGIGTINPTVKLDVKGVIRAEEVRVCLNQGCDFIFDRNYKLMPLNDLSNFIAENKHLPEIAPAAIMESEGINLSEMNAKLLQKVEELTLYVINLQKQIDELKK